jgi:hypothetical protein
LSGFFSQKITNNLFEELLARTISWLGKISMEVAHEIDLGPCGTALIYGFSIPMCSAGSSAFSRTR